MSVRARSPNLGRARVRACASEIICADSSGLKPRERKEVTEWHRIVFYRRQAEVAGEYLRKGSKVYVEGRLRTRKWQDQNGQDRYTTEIQGDVLQMLDSRSDRQSGGYAPAAQPSYPSQSQISPRSAPASKPAAEAPMDNFDDDIPF